MFQGTRFGEGCCGSRWAPGLGKKRCPDLDSLSLLVHHLDVIVELCDIHELSKILLLLGQKLLDELIQVAILCQLQQQEVSHLIALKTLTLVLLPMLLCLES